MSLQEQSYSILLVSGSEHFSSAFFGLLPEPSRYNLCTVFSISAARRMETARERLRQFEKKTLSIEEKMAEIRTVNRAKWLLISELHMSEPEAHRYIEKQAMDRCCSKRSMAEDIIKTYS